MATENKQTWGQRSKKTSVVALGLVAILAGVAVAYFLTSQKFPGNKAVGGQLTVEATLPLDFSDHPLYPVNNQEDYADQDFSVFNNNTVTVRYQMFATCEECIPDPADTPEQAAARDQKIDQFNNLYVEIQTTPAPDCSAPGTTILNPDCGAPIYSGRLADLKADTPANLGDVAAGDQKDFNVKLWLKNDPNRAQPQAVENIWEFFVNAKTPAA